MVMPAEYNHIRPFQYSLYTGVFCCLYDLKPGRLHSVQGGSVLRRLQKENLLLLSAVPQSGIRRTDPTAHMGGNMQYLHFIFPAGSAS